MTERSGCLCAFLGLFHGRGKPESEPVPAHIENERRLENAALALEHRAIVITTWNSKGEVIYRKIGDEVVVPRAGRPES